MTSPGVLPSVTTITLRALVVRNPVAPSADAERLERALEATFGAGASRVFDTTSDPDLASRLDAAIDAVLDEGCDLVIAAGGDGTVSQVVESLSRTPERRAMHLGIVPLGTANILARALRIPIDLEQAIALAGARPRVLALDAMEHANRLYLTQVGVGLDARMMEETTREARQRFGRLAYMVALFRQLAGHRSHRFTLDLDGRRVRLRAWQVIVANVGAFGAAAFSWGPGIDPGDGVVNVCVYDVRRLRDLFALAWRVFGGRYHEDERARYFTVRDQVSIRTRVPIPAQGDGEVIGSTPVTLRVRPSAVRVVVPAPEPGDVTPAGDAALGQASTPASPPPEDAAAAPADGPSPLGPAVAGAVADHATVTAAPMAAQAEPKVSEAVREIERFEPPKVRRSPLRWVLALDVVFYLAVNRVHVPMAGPVLLAASRLMDHGEGWIFLALAIGFADLRPGIPLVIEVVGALWLTMVTVNHPFKALFRRRRPFITHLEARVLGRRPLDSSFPSGHTAAGFAGATLLAPHLPALSPLFYAFAVLVGFSRVYLGVHYPSDVVIGAVAGIALALVFGALMGALVPPA